MTLRNDNIPSALTLRLIGLLRPRRKCSPYSQPAVRLGDCGPVVVDNAAMIRAEIHANFSTPALPALFASSKFHIQILI